MTARPLTLCEVRTLAGVTVDEAASKLNITKRTLRSWETQKTVPSLENAVKLCRLYKIAPLYVQWDKAQ